MEAAPEPEAASEALTSGEGHIVDDEHYQIDVDAPRYEDPAVPVDSMTPEERIAATEETAKVSAFSSTARSDAYVIDEPRPEKPATTKRVRPVKEPKPAKEPKPPRVKKEREPKPVKEPKPPREPKVREPKPAKVEKVKASKPVKTPKPPKIPSVNRANRIRLAADIIGAIGLLLSITLAIGAFFIAADIAQGSSLVKGLFNLCDALVGPLKDVFHFSGVNADKKESLVGWAIGSLGYLLIGRFLQSVLQARVKS